MHELYLIAYYDMLARCSLEIGRYTLIDTSTPYIARPQALCLRDGLEPSQSFHILVEKFSRLFRLEIPGQFSDLQYLARAHDRSRQDGCTTVKNVYPHTRRQSLQQRHPVVVLRQTKASFRTANIYTSNARLSEPFTPQSDQAQLPASRAPRKSKHIEHHKNRLHLESNKLNRSIASSNPFLPTMPPSRILDSHIHLWPSTATTSKDHGWMADPSHLLVKRHGISDYKDVTASSPAGAALAGFIYVETDRYLPSKTPDISSNTSDQEVEEKLREWAKAPLQELEFLRRVVEETPREGDGFETGEGARMKGAVVWAPFNVSTSAFSAYLRIAEEVAGPKLWEKIVGFRYLLQGKEEGEVKSLVSNDDWIENIVSLGKGRGGKGWAFDVGVDIHRDGTDPLGAVGEMILKVREREAQNGSGGQLVRFVLSKSLCVPKLNLRKLSMLTCCADHLCKHALTTNSATEPTSAWLDAVSKLGPDQDVFMKLSGAFNEFEKATPSSAAEIVKSLTPITLRVLDAFSDRVMFGSDWPVCNVGGPAGEKGNWGLWVESVELLLEEAHVAEEKTEQVWWKAGSKAYGVQL